MKRVRPKTDEIYVPHKFKDGKYRAADPRLGKDKKLAANQIPIATLEELAAYVRRGFQIRMVGTTTAQTNLIAPDKIEF